MSIVAKRSPISATALSICYNVPLNGIVRAVATFEATEAAASVVFRTVASVKAITPSNRIVHFTVTIAVT